MKRREQLEVSFHGEVMALLDDRGMGFVGLEFTEAAFDVYGEGARALSLSIPVSADVSTERATQFLRGLLPEGRALERVAAQLRLSTNDTFGLLRELGRECAGALVIAPPGELLGHAQEVDWLTDEQLADWIRALPENPLGLDVRGDVRLSLAGVQDKLVVCLHPENQAIGRPLHGTPSTHILKPSSLALDAAGMPRTPAIVENEALCMSLAQTAGLAVSSTSIRRVAGETSLMIERYDRRREEGRVVRVHQEDACQALAVDPLHKYEESGGPSFAAISQAIRDFSAEPLRDLYRLLDLAVLNLVVGNLDAHGKNISFLHQEDGRVTLAPGYDIVSVTAYPAFAGGTLAMRVGAAERIDAVSADDVAGTYAACGLPERVARRRVPGVLEQLETALEPTLQVAVDEGWYLPLLDEISQATAERIERLRT